MESVEQEAALERETALRGLGKNIAKVDAGNNEPPGATELMESVEQEGALERETALRGLGKNIAKVDAGNNEPPSITILASADVRTTPTITWPTPDPISYGEKLTFAQFNATASVEGTFLYTPGPGYVLPVGTHTLWVTFTPADSGAYAPLQAAVSIVVTRATPALSWPKPTEIIYGTELSDAQLNASAPVPGEFDYSPALGEVLPPGRHTLSVTFTPADSANYVAAQATVPLKVARATSAIQWPAPDPITYGTQLSTTQLCAVASVPGTYEYNPGLGAVLAAGEHKLSVVFTPEDTLSYSTSRTAVSLTVAKATPAITWPTPDPIAYGAAISATQLNATATVPGSFAYTPAAGEILEPGVHELSVAFTPMDTLNYTTARAVVPLAITEKLPICITWPVPSAISYGTALSATQLNATASVPGTFVYTPSEDHVLAPGKYTLSALFTPSDTEKYATAQAAVVLQVEGLPDIASSPTAATETPSTATFSAINLAPADSVPAEVTGERTATKTNPRETHTYKGAVYEKGEDGQWHLQKKSARSLPKTLPEDFNEWDSEASPTAKPVNSREEWEARLAAHSFSETPKPLGQSVDRGATPASLVDRPRDSGSASSAPVIVKQQELTGESVDGSPSRASHGLEASHATNEVPVAPGLPNVATVDGMRNSPEPTATTRREAEEAIFQLFSPKKVEVKGEQKTAKKKWMTIAAVSACSILLPLILIIPLFHHGTKSVAKPSVQPLPEAADTQLETHTPKPSAREPLTQGKPRATTEKQPATDNQPTNEEDGVTPAPVQTNMMNDQLTAPTRIPKQAAENAPPPESLGTAGADGLGGGSANASIFNGRARPVVKIAPSKPFAISSGVATGMLIQRTPPLYPPIAKTAGVAGTVELHATISTKGTIKDLHAVSGPAMLRQAAVDAVRNWRYKPYMLNNEPIEVETTINVVFTLDR
jgi:TonB family protein